MNEYINKIIQGDCLEVMKKFPDKSVDMILCDLPYGTTACRAPKKYEMLVEILSRLEIHGSMGDYLSAAQMQKMR